MTTHELEAKARELQELKRMREELDAEIELLQDSIKVHKGVREMVTAGPYKIHWTFVESVRLDTKALKTALPEVASRFSIKSITRRFCVN